MSIKKCTNIFLIGPMGSGKTTLGKALAKKLSKRFYDSDEQIEKTSGATVSWIFDIEGEEGFRKREQKSIEHLTQKRNIILATGGGAVLREKNRQNLTNRGYVIYLQVSVDEQLARLEKNQTRPLLQTADPREKLLSLIKQREQYYLTTADLIVSTDQRSIQMLVEEICSVLQNLTVHEKDICE